MYMDNGWIAFGFIYFPFTRTGINNIAHEIQLIHIGTNGVSL